MSKQLKLIEVEKIKSQNELAELLPSLGLAKVPPLSQAPGGNEAFLDPLVSDLFSNGEVSVFLVPTARKNPESDVPQREQSVLKEQNASSDQNVINRGLPENMPVTRAAHKRYLEEQKQLKDSVEWLPSLSILPVETSTTAALDLTVKMEDNLSNIPESESSFESSIDLTEPLLSQSPPRVDPVVETLSQVEFPSFQLEPLPEKDDHFPQISESVSPLPAYFAQSNLSPMDFLSGNMDDIFGFLEDSSSEPILTLRGDPTWGPGIVVPPLLNALNESSNAHMQDHSYSQLDTPENWDFNMNNVHRTLKLSNPLPNLIGSDNFDLVDYLDSNLLEDSEQMPLSPPTSPFSFPAIDGLQPLTIRKETGPGAEDEFVDVESIEEESNIAISHYEDNIDDLSDIECEDYPWLNDMLTPNPT
ncbi:uncharacterized protein LOC108088712 [Drosophila ficusphila]|uniref:uncharacterized protein LOC108088712 n=1 Tax=Drosophila ficusphila TaxID=30025 RepID=UPI0007E5BF03|nr:uncharacterized protein LOC108088712 [Drosophila ficusphila]